MLLIHSHAMMRTIYYCVALFLLGRGVVYPQTCPKEPANMSRIAEILDSAKDSAVIYRAAAISEQAAVIRLRGVAQPNMRGDTVPGAAQVALAKLGDSAAIQDLQKELNASKNNRGAIEKLLRVRTDSALAILIEYFIAHEHDRSRVVDHGDYAYDPLALLLAELPRIVPDPPEIPADATFDQQIKGWEEWWTSHKNHPVIIHPAKEFSSVYLQCLGRKIDWGFPDAVLEISLYDSNLSAPAFRKLLGPRMRTVAKLHTLDGNLQTALARAGDENELHRIENELQVSTKDAIEKLQFIGGRRAVEALIHSLDSSDEEVLLRKFYAPKDASHLALEHQRSLMYVLSKLVKDPPLSPTAPGQHGAATWTAWWAREKDRAVFNEFLPDYIHE